MLGKYSVMIMQLLLLFLWQLYWDIIHIPCNLCTSSLFLINFEFSLTQGLNLGLLYWKQILYHLSHQENLRNRYHSHFRALYHSKKKLHTHYHYSWFSLNPRWPLVYSYSLWICLYGHLESQLILTEKVYFWPSVLIHWYMTNLMPISHCTD